MNHYGIYFEVKLKPKKMRSLLSLKYIMLQLSFNSFWMYKIKTLIVHNVNQLNLMCFLFMFHIEVQNFNPAL